MIALFWLFLAVSVSPFKSKNRLAAENAALRHQLIVLQRRVRGRVQLTNGDRLFLVLLYRWFPSVPDDGGRGCEAPEPRAREPCQRAFTHRQPHEECACPSRDPGIQATSAQSARASSMSADSGGHGPTGKHHRGAPARHGTAGVGP